MRFCIGLLYACAILLVGCDSNSNSSPTTPSNDGKEKAAAPVEITGQEDHWWQLPDDSHLEVFIEPWPATSGASTLRVHVTEDDFEQKFKGTVQFRMTATKESADAWIPMTRAGMNDGDVVFKAPVELQSGSQFVQFRVNEKDGFAIDLLDLKIEVKERSK